MRKTTTNGSATPVNPNIRGDAPRMLLVEVSMPMRRLLTRRLKQSAPDIHVVGAGSVAEAVRAIDGLKPKTILLSLNLPDGSGREVLRHAMALDPYCMIVVLTDRADAQTRLECFEEGADFVFDKSAAFERAIETAGQATRRQVARSPRCPVPRPYLSEEFVLANRSGLHVLPAARLVKLANEYRAAIEIVCEGRKANAKVMVEVMALGAECGARIAVTATGSDADQAMAGIRSLVAKNFHDARCRDRPGRNAPPRRVRP